MKAIFGKCLEITTTTTICTLKSYKKYLLLKHNTNHKGIHLLKNAVLTDGNANKIIKRL